MCQLVGSGREEDRKAEMTHGNAEGELHVREHLGGLVLGEQVRVGEVLRGWRKVSREGTLVIGSVHTHKHDEGRGRDLGADVAEPAQKPSGQYRGFGVRLDRNRDSLSEEAEDGVLALPERALVVVTGGLLLLLDRGLGDFRELGKAEEREEGKTEAGDGEVDVLNGAERVLVLAAEKGLGGDLRADEGGETVELLRARW